MAGIIKWLERLSLDAVVVAVVWGAVLGDLAGRGIDAANLLILSLSTWLTYVADRLRDVGQRRVVPGTDRHLYYKTHFNVFSRWWGSLFAADLLLAIWLLPCWKIGYGCLLVAGIIVYLLVVARLSRPSWRILFKRVAVPVIFSVGVGWMAESWRTPGGQHATVVLLAGAVANLLLISDWENIGKREIPWLFPALVSVLFLMAMTGMAGMLGALCYCLVALLARRRKVPHVRAIADGVLVLMAIAVALG